MAMKIEAYGYVSTLEDALLEIVAGADDDGLDEVRHRLDAVTDMLVTLIVALVKNGKLTERDVEALLGDGYTVTF